MRDPELTDANPEARKSTRQNIRRSALRGAKTLLVGTLAAGLVVSGASVANAAVGGGGFAGGGSGGGLATGYWLFTGDYLDASYQPVQGWGQDSIDYFREAMDANYDFVNTIDPVAAMNSACGEAIDNAIARSDGASTRARVIQVGVSVGESGGNWYMGWGGVKSEMDPWYRDLTLDNYWQGDLPGYSQTLLNRVRNTFLNSIPSNPRIVCVALNDMEVNEYELEIETDATGTFATAGSTSTVRDRIITDTDSTIREDVEATVFLRWGHLEDSGYESVSKTVTLPNKGTTDSPAFTPSDFGWASWPAGKYWFNVSVPKQGKMSAAASHLGASDSRENWTAAPTAPTKRLVSGTGADEDVLASDEVLVSGQEYRAEIKARTNGYTSSMTITDTINTSNVWIGSATADVASNVKVLSPNGVAVGSAEIKITRSSGKVVVSGTVKNIPDGFQAREYTLVVPTFMRPSTSNYTIADDSEVCYTAAMSDCIEGNSRTTRKVTPSANKVWVLDEAGALTASDPSKTNAVGADNKVFAPGSPIGAVVNGSIPAKLAEPMASYVITDDWSDSAKYIDFSDASKVKVYLDGVNVTSQFSISISGNKTTATARAAFLTATKGRAAAGEVKLYIGGTFRTNYDTEGELEQLSNSGSQSWNGETADTNTPSVFTVTPAPDKVWVLDETGALAAFDPNGTNTAGVGGKTFAPGSAISAVVNGSVPADLAVALSNYVITDDWTASAAYVDFSDASKAKVFLDGVDVTSQFTVTVSGTRTIATAKAAFLTATRNRAAAGEVKLFITGQFRNDYDTDGDLERLWNNGSERWNDKTVATNAPSIYTVTPTPDKVWVLDEDGALSTSDEDWTNTVGADERVFLQNDAVAAVVNGSIPANLGSALFHYSIVDDWTDAVDYVDFSDASQVKVFVNGADRTDAFDIAIVGTTTVATAKPAFLATTANMGAAAKIKLVISGAFRDDYDTDGQIVTLTNSGSETWNNRTEATNSPAVYAWTPNPNKQVLGSAEESGSKAHDDINGATVWPGQKLEYSVGIDLRIPAGTARGIKSLVVEDVYDPYFTPDKSSVEFWDSRDASNPKPVARSAYKLAFDDAAHTFTATFTDAWIAKNVSEEGDNSRWLTQGWLTMRVTGTVSKAVPAGATVTNQAFQIINGARTATEIPEVKIPVVTPEKDALSNTGADIDGKTVVAGDEIVYRLLLDGGPARSELAYNVHKFGIVDDFDDEYLALDESAITVVEQGSGDDVTDAFNVQVKDGIAYIFAKTVDTEGVYGGIISGDPQPADLAAYDKADIRPLEDAIIDQDLLGKKYWVTLRTVVKKEQDGHVIENKAVQNIQNTLTETRVVSNPLKDIDPTKDVVVSEETKDQSIDGTEVRMNSVFNYRLNSSEIPADRAYAARQWSMSDTFDRVHDQYTGIWAIYANTDVYDGSELIFKTGDLLQDSAGHEAEPFTGMFEVAFDEDSYTITIDATQKYLNLIGTRPDLANAFSVYVKMIRIAPGEHIVNTVTESYNDFQRDSNEVDTLTNEYPEIEIRKFTSEEGEIEGSHGSLKNAQVMTAAELKIDKSTKLQNGIVVGIRYRNAGDVPLKDVTLVDVTHEGLHGQLEGIRCLVPFDPTAPTVIQGTETITPDENGMVWATPGSSTSELPLNGAVDCRGTLRGMERGMTHGDTVLVTGKSIFTDTLVKAEDTWFAVAPSTPAIQIIEYTLDESQTKGDRNEKKDALALSEDRAKNGVKVAFDITNTGDEKLTAVQFANATQKGATGKVADVKWLDPIAKDAAAKVKGEIVTLKGVRYLERDVKDLKELAVGQKVLLVGTLQKVKTGTHHTDLAEVTGTGEYSAVKVTDSDPWNARVEKAVVVEEPPTGVVAGEAIELPGQRDGLLAGAGLLLMAAALVRYIARRRVRVRRGA